ncbi:hypothetical protein DM01DRAFT_1331908 [Hesseltinella vesiculosa]|uniref:BZIP domain-containing protein n=1 Tax=Hesseltinella vesiculosa TaxID=101127 RepID=A0A1X2GTB6_9FUNG|nr:hypothetical protein DM01DRAFT_1331908 [Hesseltinella vesiculosa]
MDSTLSSTPPLLSSPLISHASISNNTANLTSCSAAALAAAASVPPPPLTFPTTEQIKQLIELAKHQLALRQAATALLHSKSKDGSKKKANSPAQDDQYCIDKKDAKEEESLGLSAADTTLFSANQDDLPDTVSPESLIKPAKSSTNNNKKAPLTESPVVDVAADIKLPDESHEFTSMKKSRRDSTDDAIGSLEAYAETDGIDIKKLTPKERRQLRNKISARNFRVRRKEYITTLEQQVSEHKKRAEEVIEQLSKVEDENKQLRMEVDCLKRQNLQLQQQVVC